MSHHSVVISFLKKSGIKVTVCILDIFSPVLFNQFCSQSYTQPKLFGTYYHEDVVKEEPANINHD